MFRRLKPLLLGGFIPLAVCLPAMGQDASPVSLSIEEAVQLAVRNSPRLVAARGDVRSTSFGVSSARALVNPNAFFAPGITSVSGTGEEFLIQQPLEINGVRSARAGIARAGQREAEARSLSTLRETVYAAQVAYYELARAREQVAVAREALTVAREFDRIARRQVEEGVRPGIELAQTGLEISRSQVQFTSAEGREESARAALNTVIGRDTGDAVGKLSPLIPTELPPAETEPGTVAIPPVDSHLPAPYAPIAPAQPSDLSTATLLGLAVSSRAEIAGGTASAQRFRAEADLARAEGRPDIVPQFRVGYFTRGLEPASSGNGAGIGVAITLPILDYGSRRNRVRQAEESARAQDARVDGLRRDIEREAAQSIARERAARRTVDMYRADVLPQAKRLLDGSRIGFREGRTSVISLIEAGRSYRTVQSEYVNALAEAALARAELSRATGAVSPADFPERTNP